MPEERFQYRTPVVIGDNTYKQQVLHQIGVLRTELGYINIKLENMMPCPQVSKLQDHVLTAKRLLFHAYNMVELFDEPPDDGRYIRPGKPKEEEAVGGGTHDGTDPMQKPWLRNMVEETLSRADLGPKALIALGVLEMRKQQQDDEHDRLRRQFQEVNNMYVERERALKDLLRTIKYILKSEAEEAQLRLIQIAIRQYELAQDQD